MLCFFLFLTIIVASQEAILSPGYIVVESHP